ncbi:uncharacterized protein yc1106_05149 [Curvularia clavata]|uniref:Protein transport protein Sec61 subunit beta n=1 Tax=Curvularia clavata TaxID=95742 RepID=A0A9Q9DTC5_CURCL|nr:uncharacterized protein yc1106_05149 [Curvularia clavata]
MVSCTPLERTRNHWTLEKRHVDCNTGACGGRGGRQVIANRGWKGNYAIPPCKGLDLFALLPVQSARNQYPLHNSAPRATSPNAASSGSTTARPASPKPPGGPATVMRRKAAADRAEKTANQRPSSTRAAGAGGSSSTMLRLYTDESPGLKVDPVVVMTLSVVFIFSVVALHVIAKVMRRFSA